MLHLDPLVNPCWIDNPLLQSRLQAAATCSRAPLPVPRLLPRPLAPAMPRLPLRPSPRPLAKTAPLLQVSACRALHQGTALFLCAVCLHLWRQMRNPACATSSCAQLCCGRVRYPGPCRCTGASHRLRPGQCCCQRCGSGRLPGRSRWVIGF